MSVRDAATVLRARGFALTKPDPHEKKPTYRGWSTFSYPPEQFGDGDMIGVMGGPLSDGGKPGHALVIIDLDTREAVELADEYLPQTGMSEGRAGKPRSHRYYLVRFDTIPDWAVSQADQGAPAAKEQKGHAGPFLKSFRHRETEKEVIRFLGTGGQAVCPPSVWQSEDGTQREAREWDGGEPGEPAVVPFLELWDAVARLASRCGAKVPAVGPTVFVFKDKPPATVLERAEKYLAKIPGAVSGAGGHDQLFTAARHLVWGFALPEDDAMRLLVRDYNPRCSPQWSEKELRHKVEDAGNVPSNKPRGYLRDAERKGFTSGGGGNEDESGQGAFTVDAVDNPHRLAIGFLKSVSPDAPPALLRQWRDDFHEWHAGAYHPRPDGDIRGRVVAWVRDEFLRLNRIEVEKYLKEKAEANTATETTPADKGGKEKKPKQSKCPVVRPITTKLTGDVMQALRSVALLPASTEQPAWINGAESDRAPVEVISAPNGLFALEDIAAGKGAFSQPTPDLFTATALPFPVPTVAAAPTNWLRCLDQWFSGDAASVAGLREWFGYLLSGSVDAHKILMLIGPQRSGKGTVIRILTELVGLVNVASTTFTALGENFGLEALLGKRVAIIPDARLSKRPDLSAVVERLLSISGGDAQSVNRKNRTRITTTLGVRFVLASNELPRMPEASGALASRFHILKLPNSFAGREDRGLYAKLAGELPGILKWAAEGWVALKANGLHFTPNSAADDIRRELADLSSPVGAFVRECCTVGPTEAAERSLVFNAWEAWCDDHKCKPSGEGVFGRDLRAVLPHIRSESRRNAVGKRTRFYVGVGVRKREDWGDLEQVVQVVQGGTGSFLTHACGAVEKNGSVNGHSGGYVSAEHVPPCTTCTTPDGFDPDRIEREGIDQHGGG